MKRGEGSGGRLSQTSVTLDPVAHDENPLGATSSDFSDRFQDHGKDRGQPLLGSQFVRGCRRFESGGTPPQSTSVTIDPIAVFRPRLRGWLGDLGSESVFINVFDFSVARFAESAR